MSVNIGRAIWQLALNEGFTIIPTDGLSDGGARYTDDEMILMAFDYVCSRRSDEEFDNLLENLLARKE